jgi:hypothetical protein
VKSAAVALAIVPAAVFGLLVLPRLYALLGGPSSCFLLEMRNTF